MADHLNQEFVRLVADSGWNQTQVAEKLGITPSAVSQIVNGQVRPSVTTIRLLKMLLGEATPTDDVPQSLLSAGKQQPLATDEIDVINSLRELYDADRANLVNHIRHMAGSLPKKVSYKSKRTKKTAKD